VQHCDPEVLALAALGETPAAADAEHLSACADCRDEVAALSRVVDGVRVEAAPASPVVPPARVWDAIAAGTGVTVAPRPERVAGAPAQGTAAGADAAGAEPPRTHPAFGREWEAERARGGARRRGRPGGTRERNRLLLAVAASLLVGAAAGVFGTSVAGRNPSSGAQPVQVITQIDLANLKQTAATGHAAVVVTPAGRSIRVDTSRLASLQGGFYEVWLIDKQVKKMVGIGILHPGEDEFPVPNGVDLAQYPIVDISVQQPGDPRHSGDSVLRGTITG
jgi:hypothetical protein